MPYGFISPICAVLSQYQNHRVRCRALRKLDSVSYWVTRKCMAKFDGRLPYIFRLVLKLKETDSQLGWMKHLTSRGGKGQRGWDMMWLNLEEKEDERKFLENEDTWTCLNDRVMLIMDIMWTLVMVCLLTGKAINHEIKIQWISDIHLNLKLACDVTSKFWRRFI